MRLTYGLLFGQRYLNHATSKKKKLNEQTLTTQQSAKSTESVVSISRDMIKNLGSASLRITARE